MSARIDIVLPVHNEAESIGATLEEFHRVVACENHIPIRFVVCEDGSSDKTVEVLRDLSRTLPIHLLTEKDRKGYSRAVIDGLRAAQSDLVGFIDSDGQCDPADFPHFVQEHAQGDYDLVFGYRNPRHDHPVRIIMSRAFGMVYRSLFTIPLRDPSCPFLLIRQDSLQRLFKGNLGLLKQGFWWEFIARCVAAGFKIKEIPVAHRPRAAGQTQVYLPTKVPGIAYEHLKGLYALRSELKVLYPSG
ncbi:MAG: glycosyltransferase family 2 protein [Verrucomicrobiota bacterium]|nr:glycosyltransferase family 2 protein [Verrucomicrobiota bacterium]